MTFAHVVSALMAIGLMVLVTSLALYVHKHCKRN